MCSHTLQTWRKSKLELVFKKTGPLQFLFTFPKVIQFICLVLTFIMNVFILIGYNVENDKDQKDVLKNVILFGLTEKSKYNYWLILASDLILRIIGIVLACFSALIFAEFLTRRAPLIYRKIYVRILY